MYLRLFSPCSHDSLFLFPVLNSWMTPAPASCLFPLLLFPFLLLPFPSSSFLSFSLCCSTFSPSFPLRFLPEYKLNLKIYIIFFRLVFEWAHTLIYSYLERRCPLIASFNYHFAMKVLLGVFCLLFSLLNLIFRSISEVEDRNKENKYRMLFICMKSRKMVPICRAGKGHKQQTCGRRGQGEGEMHWC